MTQSNDGSDDVKDKGEQRREHNDGGDEATDKGARKRVVTNQVMYGTEWQSFKDKMRDKWNEDEGDKLSKKLSDDV